MCPIKPWGQIECRHNIISTIIAWLCLRCLCYIVTSWLFGVLEYQHVNRAQYFECQPWDSCMMLNPLAFVQILQYINCHRCCTPAMCTFSITAQKGFVLWNQKELTNNKIKASNTIEHRPMVWPVPYLTHTASPTICIFFCSWETFRTFTHDWTCTVVNFQNLHSLLGQLGSLVFEQMESSD